MEVAALRVRVHYLSGNLALSAEFKVNW